MAINTKTEQAQANPQVRENEAIEEQHADFLNRYQAATSDEERMQMIADVENGTPHALLAGMFQQIKRGENISDVLNNGLHVALPIWLNRQIDNTTVPTGYKLLDDLIKVVNVDNGNETMDYQDYTSDGDAKNPFFGSQMSTDAMKTWLKLTLSNGELAGMETYKASHIYHNQALTYKPMFDNTHKDMIYFTMQFNLLLVKIGQPKLAYLLKLRMKYLFGLFQGEADIIDTEDGITFNQTVLPDPDEEITATDGYNLSDLFDVKLQGLQVPRRDHFKKGGATEALMGIQMGMSSDGKTPNIVQLNRSVNFDDPDTRIVVSTKFIAAIDKGLRAGAFNQEYADFMKKYRDKFVVLPYEQLFDSVYGNFKLPDNFNTIAATGKDKIEGSTDIWIMTADTLSIITQWSSSTDTELPNNTVAHNYWDNNGLSIHKFPKNFYYHLRLTVGSAPADNKASK